MKCTYKTPYIFIEVLKETDVLLASESGSGSDNPPPPSSELENAYRDIMSFLQQSNWF
ncbi:MAG: hypothetical protein K6F88_05490 [Ruminococcus sp.]|nr:hypothetical protein [Ruminococcus sp.]